MAISGSNARERPAIWGEGRQLMSNQYLEKEVVLMLTDTTIRRLDTLGMLSKQGKRINGLFRLMDNTILWQQAYANIYANRGAVTKGVDGSSLDGMSVERFTRIIEALKNGNYRFTPVRRVFIPKSNGKARPLGIPSGDDRLVQEVARMLLEKIYEPIFSKDSHGFRNAHSCHTALAQVHDKWTGVKWIVNMDIKGFFDNIDHDIMLKILEKRIDDKRFLALIRSMLKAGYVEDWRYHDTFSGTPQGGIVSPILANIYLHELDEFMAEMRAEFNNGSRRKASREYKSVSHQISKCMKQIDALKQLGENQAVEELKREIREFDLKRKNASSQDPMDANYRWLVYIRYADDFLIGIIGSQEEAKSIMQQVAKYLGNELHLEIAENKSDVVHASQPVRFLGYDVNTYTGNRIVKTVREGRHTTIRSVTDRMQLHIPQEKLQGFCQSKGYGNYASFHPLHRKALTNLSEPEIVCTYNAEMRGIANYYRLVVNAKRDLNKLHGIWRGSLLKTLAEKRRSSVKKVVLSLKRKDTQALVVQGNKDVYVFPLYSLADMKTGHSIYPDVDILPKTWAFSFTNSELIQRMETQKCEYCGTTQGPFEVHHIRKMADVVRGKQLWEIAMARKRRKTLVMCVPCHKKLHAGRLG